MLATLGRFCVRRRWSVLLAWVLFVGMSFTAGSAVFDRLEGGDGNPSAESVRGWQLLQDSAPTGPRIVGLVDDAAVDDPDLRAELTAAAQDLARVEGVAAVASWPTTGDPRLVSRDRTAQLVVVDLEADLEEATRERAVDTVSDRLRGLEEARVRLGGGLLLEREIDATVEEDLQRGEMISLPIALVLLVVVFGGVVAAGLPVIAAVATIAGSLLALLGFSTVVELDSDVISVVTVLGLGLAIDYGLLMVSRFREERGRGLDVAAAVERTVVVCGRTITFSALTVAASLAGLFVFVEPEFRNMGAGGVSVVLLALLAGLTLTPALLAVVGGRIKPERRPPTDDGFFASLTRRVQRRPLPVALVTGLLLLAAGAPFLQAEFKDGGPALIPKSFETRQVADALAAGFEGRSAEPVVVVARTTATDPAWRAFVDSAGDTDDVVAVRERTGYPGLVAVDLVPAGTGEGAVAKDLVDRLRADRPVPGALVTGDAAFLLDFQRSIVDRLPWALALIFSVTFVLLFLMTGSVLVPVKALVMNTLSLGASFGALVLVFQEGWLAGPLGIDPPGALETWVPVIVFVFAFGTSMDYEVFLLSRVVELREQGYSTREAVAVGLQRSGRIITCAAALMVVVFTGFAAGRMAGIKEMGMALAIAVAVDATVVRCLLVPATMSLLGEWNWWAPAPLRRLHDRFGLREAGAPRVIDLTDAVPGQRDAAAGLTGAGAARPPS